MYIFYIFKNIVNTYIAGIELYILYSNAS